MRDAQGMRRNAASSEFETIDNSLLDAVVHKLEDYGFPPALINSTLANSTMNQIAATYILLIQKHVFKE